LTVAVPALLGHDVVGAARTALRIHRQDYTAPRSYLLWLPFNLLDTAIFLGLPVAALLVRRAGEGGLPSRVVLGALLLLDVTGTVRGEAGRIWTPLLPFLLLGACPPGWGGAHGALAVGAMQVGLAATLRAAWHVF
jgi:hypothetical protein